jgi:hypothetical protein
MVFSVGTAPRPAEIELRESFEVAVEEDAEEKT